MAKVSIVIPAYNSVDFIEQTISSIEAQTYRDFEIIVSDHSSTDGTAEVLSRLAEEGRISLTTLPTGGGAPANWRAVSAQANGEYLKLVCGDDLLSPQILALQVAALDDNPSVVMAASQRDLVDAQGKQIMPARGLGGLNGICSGAEAVRRSVRKGANIFGEPGCVLLRREALEAAGGWCDEQPYVIDQFSYCNTLLHGDFAAIPGKQASFRVSAGQWSVHLTTQQANQVVGMHHALAERNPGLLSQTDLLIGDARAHAMAQARRLTYLWLGKRMRTAQATTR